mmetsp:Transcript_50793/g.147988  ORF Transcript_50793/g.147988 Transcript_50793/m.147988 type:complete len:205 (-) Transcript_50793:1902-2516(-)
MMRKKSITSTSLPRPPVVASYRSSSSPLSSGLRIWPSTALFTCAAVKPMHPISNIRSKVAWWSARTSVRKPSCAANASMPSEEIWCNFSSARCTSSSKSLKSNSPSSSASQRPMICRINSPSFSAFFRTIRRRSVLPTSTLMRPVSPVSSWRKTFRNLSRRYARCLERMPSMSAMNSEKSTEPLPSWSDSRSKASTCLPCSSSL